MYLQVQTRAPGGSTAAPNRPSVSRSQLSHMYLRDITGRGTSAAPSPLTAGPLRGHNTG